ncbi:MAG: acetyl-CoA carboxylase biotin carboxyl carrier protein subunit [Bdellovibrionales bacterium]|nr:acetyl-CoA carboxylase biotin carboxyl carrier protein subunit [Bdellovibrionales bacterium]
MSKAALKFSGVKAEFPELSGEAGWTFDSRPGGWIIAARTREDGSTERKRFYYHRDKDRFWAKFVRTGAGATAGGASDFYGQKIEYSRGGAAGGGAQNDFTAQFPGKVRKVLVADGTTVETGTPILMVEAMKMEFAIKCETKGIVKKILVQEGQQLAPGQKLVDFVTEAAPAKEGKK